MKRLLPFLLSCVAALGATRYVSKTGNDTTGDGSSGSPWLTVQKAATSSTAGDTVLVGAGVYAETVTTASALTFDGQGVATVTDGFNVNHAGTTIKNFTITRQGLVGSKSDCIISGNTFGPGVYVNSTNISTITGAKDYFTVTDRDFVAAGFRVGDTVRVDDVDGGELFSSSGQNYTVDTVATNRLTITAGGVLPAIPSGTMVWIGIQSSPIFVYASSWPTNWVISSNLFTEAGAIAIQVYGDGHRITGNTFSNLTYDAIYFFGSSNRIDHNYFTLCGENSKSAPSPGHCDLFQSYGQDGHPINNLLFENNLAYDCDAQMWHLETKKTGGSWNDFGNFTIRNNIFIDVYARGNSYATNTYVYGNTFVRVETLHGAGAVYFGESDVQGYAHNSTLINNAFIDCFGSTTNSPAFFRDINVTNVTVDYNYMSTGTNFLARTVSSSFPEYNQFGAHSVNGGDPKVANVLGSTAASYVTGSGSVLREVGADLSAISTEDYAGNVRGVPYDIGAYESGGVIPSISSQPTSIYRQVGTSASFTISATGTAPLAYQWSKDGSAITDATNSTYTINSCVLGDSGSYSCTVTNDYWSATSGAAVLTVDDLKPRGHISGS